LIYGVLSVLAFYLAVGHNAALVCFLIGFVYPAYSTLKMFLSDRKKEDEQQWYTYWIIFSVCTMLDVYGDEIWHIFPFYYVIKSVSLDGKLLNSLFSGYLRELVFATNSRSAFCLP
jgi:receptor expression-enhancing protein 5/6